MIKLFSWNDVLVASKDKNHLLSQFTKKGSALSVGGFDGPHLGHKELFQQVIDYKTKNNVVAGVVTFKFPPKAAKNPTDFSGELSSINLKLEYFEEIGFDFIVLIDFSCDFSKIKGRDFLAFLKNSCSMQFLVAGSDFRCGYKLDTGILQISEFAAQNGISFNVVEDYLFQGKRISSTIIRDFVQKGELEKASKLLGRAYALDLRNALVQENKETSQLQIANSSVIQLLPPVGKYQVKVTLADTSTFSSVMYVESTLLRLEIPLEQKLQKLKKIEFCL
ncbi:MAG: FAD synthetase family protein [Spirochaetaceae bacterium]|nr:FAD synthetase family protein [Spirochaetaceae bacterium]